MAKALVSRLVATGASSVKVSVALDVATATELVKAGFPARFMAWGGAADLTVGRTFEQVLVLGVTAERTDKDKDGNPVVYPAETQLALA